MSKISLRAYNREIETLIERGHSEEAIAHCKYILKTYAKHLDTYRLLGKAFLESQRYGEAADILNRILSVIPDDFVAQIGMSIIREDEGNLDAAIFHMERSFEIQPSNAAIQDELRRLYGRRDGIEPPKLRLTRGALVRMYARGDLYRQAIAEARAAIKEDPQRLDLEIVLAQMYYQTGQKAEAAEICSRLVMKLPYCMEANRILAEVLPETSRSDDAKIYQQRLVALEPYLAYQSDPSQGIAQVPDNAVTLDHLEWIPSLESSQQPAWANNLGLEIEEKEEAQMPDWLSRLSDEQKDTSGEEITPQPIDQEPEPFHKNGVSSISEPTDASLRSPEDQLLGSTAKTQTDADLPDWMKELGETPAVSEEEKLPDWMQGMGDASAASEVEQTPAWSQSTGETPAASEEKEAPDWLQGLAETSTFSEEEKTTPASEEDETPAWMQGVDETTSASKEEKLPDWMQSSGWKITENPSETPGEDLTASLEDSEAEETTAAPAEIPDWLKDLEPIPGEENLAELPSSPEISAAENVLNPIPETNLDQGLPEWLKSPATTPEENIDAQAQEPLPDWLIESPDRLNDLTETHASIEDSSQNEQSIAETQPTATQTEPEVDLGSVETNVPAISEATVPESIPDLDNMDDAMAWLESLAAKQGADEETLLTKPEERLDTPPDWVAQAAAASETAPVETEEQPLSSEFVEPQVVPDQPVSRIYPADEVITQPILDEEQVSVEDEPVAAVENVVPEPVAEEVTQPMQGELHTTIGEEPTGETENVVSEPVSEVQPIMSDETDQAEVDSAFAWLESLAAKQGAEPDSLLVSSEERLENPPDWIQQESAGVEPQFKQETIEPLSEVPPETAAPLRDWQASTEAVEMPTAEIPKSDEILPDWLNEEAMPQDSAGDFILPPAEDFPITPEEAQVPVESPVDEEFTTDWIKESEEPVSQVDVEPTIAENEEIPETGTFEVSGEPEPLPDWLSSDLAAPSAVIETPAQDSETPALPDWLQAEPQAEESLPADSARTVDEGETPALPDWLKDLESEQEKEEPLPIEGGYDLSPAEPQNTAEISQIPDEMILQAQDALGKGQIDFALSIYQRLIDQDQKLDETIHDLRDSLYRFPVDSVIWQTLGDAYMRDNQIQAALDAFTKAEELLK